MTSMARLPRQQFSPAFSLIEVVMAISIVAFALVAIASTLPVGLQSMRDSQNDQAVATIQNQLRGELQQISFDPNDTTATTHLQDLPNSRYYYTVEGVKTTAPPNVALPPYYQAQFTVNTAGVNGNLFDNGGAVTPANAASITVTLTYPYPALSQTTSFSMLAAKQVGKQ